MSQTGGEADLTALREEIRRAGNHSRWFRLGLLGLLVIGLGLAAVGGLLSLLELAIAFALGWAILVKLLPGAYRERRVRHFRRLLDALPIERQCEVVYPLQDDFSGDALEIAISLLWPTLEMNARLTPRPSPEEVALGLARRVPIHVAGHIVAAHDLGQELARVSLVPDGNAPPEQVCPFWPADVRTESPELGSEPLLRRAVVSLVGWRAETRVYAGSLKDPLPDIFQCETAILAAMPRGRLWRRPDSRAWIKAVRQRAEKLLEDRWEVIKTLADELQKRGEMSPMEVRSFLDRQPSPRPTEDSSPEVRGDEASPAS